MRVEAADAPAGGWCGRRMDFESKSDPPDSAVGASIASALIPTASVLPAPPLDVAAAGEVAWRPSPRERHQDYQVPALVEHLTSEECLADSDVWMSARKYCRDRALLDFPPHAWHDDFKEIAEEFPTACSQEGQQATYLMGLQTHIALVMPSSWN